MDYPTWIVKVNIWNAQNKRYEIENWSFVTKNDEMANQLAHAQAETREILIQVVSITREDDRDAFKKFFNS